MTEPKTVSIIDALHKMQQEINCPKNRHNKFGGYNYRAAEDIMVAAKAIMPSGYVLTVSDAIEQYGDRIYVAATATLTNGKDSIHNKAYAREALTKKGMDEAQITGATSSYARKYALAGLFCLDDEQDADDSNDHGNDTRHEKAAKQEKAKPEPKQDADADHPVFSMTHFDRANNPVTASVKITSWVAAFEKGCKVFGQKFVDANISTAALVCQYKPELEAQLNAIISKTEADADNHNPLNAG